uniref:Uncharacterized protein n=1 Tax=Avena sativa TaxID=4498 RepID=A0ACD5W4P0_AVESA
MFLRANAGEEMGFVLAHPRQPGNLGFPWRETGWPDFFLGYSCHFIRHPAIALKRAQKRERLASASEAPRAPQSPEHTCFTSRETEEESRRLKRDTRKKKKKKNKEMVAMGAEEDERPVHQGCMAGFLHLFDRPQILSGKRLYHQPRRLLSSSSGSATPSEMSMPLDRGSERATPLPSSPDMTPPAAPRPSLQLPPLDLKDRGAAAASWRLPRLSLDSRAVVDAKGKLRPRDIRTSSPAAAPPSPGMGGDERRSPSVVARLMGLDALPHGAADEEDGQHGPRGGELRRSASERVPRDPARFRFVDPTFFEKPAPPVLLPPQPQRPSSPTTEVALRRSPDPAYHRAALQRRSSHFDAREVFPEPAKRPSPVSVLDAAAFLADEDSPSSSGSKRGMEFRAASPRPVAASDLDDDEWVPEAWLVGPQASDPDFGYVAEAIRLLDRMKDPDDVYKTIEKRRQRGEDTWQHRRLLCGAAAEAFDRWRCAHPSEPVAWLRGEELLQHVWAEVQRVREPVALAPAADDLNDLTCGVILRDLAADRRWSPSAEAAEAVLQIERLLFKDLVADTIRELADVDRLRLPRRKLVF